MIEVHVKGESDEAFKKAMSIFKKKCNKAGFIREIKERRYFKKPSQKNREYKEKLQREAERKTRKRRKLY